MNRTNNEIEKLMNDFYSRVYQLPENTLPTELKTIADNVGKVLLQKATPEFISEILKTNESITVDILDWANKWNKKHVGGLERYREAKMYLDNYLSENRKDVDPKNKTQILSNFKPKFFTEIFVNPNHVNKCLQLLKNLEKPAIDEMNNFLRDKGVFVVWLQQLEVKGLLKVIFANDKERAETLNFNFTGLKISDSTFRSENRKAQDFKSFFAAELSVIKTEKQQQA